MRVVVNTSPLIALDRIGSLHVLRELYGRVVRPQAVLDELLAGQARYPLSGQLLSADWIETQADPPEVFLRRELGSGESAAIMLARQSGADLIVLDDLQARLVAASLNIRLTGTLGVLLAAHKAGIIPDIRDTLRALLKVGFRLPPSISKDYGV